MPSTTGDEMMKKTALLVWLGLSAAAAQAQTPDTLARVMESKQLRVCSPGDYKPFSFDNQGKFEGIDNDLMQVLAKSLGAEVVMVKTSWPDLMKDFTSGKCDIGVGGISITLPRQQQALFSEPYFTNGKTPLVRCADVAKYQTVEAINRPNVRIVANPFLLPYVSIYSRVRPSLEKIHQFFDAIPYGQVKLSLLPFNGFPQYALTPRKLPQMVSFDLIMDYDSVDQRFTSLFDQERYAKWEPQLSIVRTQNLSDYLTFRSAVGQKHAMEEIYLKRLISYALRFKSVGIYVAHDGVNMPVAMMVMVKCDNRLVVVDTARQRNDCGSSGLFYILRHVVRVNAESNLVLNFPCRPFFLTEASKPFCLYGVQYKKGMMRFI